ncbi:MAG: sulfatase-like hydrolase/transferase [Kiritimatiellia bacterium]|jgi:arylsulfatase A-like enzyme|nr:sulfatase-like hydrolase/transferase [Kiritimatiellia bacterium]
MTNRRDFLKGIGLASAGLIARGLPSSAAVSADRPNIVLIMTDDQGWGQTGYYNHPVLKTPNLDAMAANGLRFDRFYAGAPVCSPTRATVLTGRANDRTGVPSHGHALRLQEKTLPAALKAAGYATGHFGKWHLNALRGPGVPVLAEDSHNPGAFGFDEWLTVTNFFDMNPIMSRKGKFEEFNGDSSAIIVNEALKFMTDANGQDKPFLAVIWDGSPHVPWKASEEDKRPFKELGEASQNHYGELAAFDRSVGVLRKALLDLGIADNTIVWFCSDNGGLGVKPGSVGGLRGLKGSVYEGGLRVPGIIEWPATIKPRITEYPASTMDIFPTIADILDLPGSVFVKPVDGISLTSLFKKNPGKRAKPIPFRFRSKGALVDNDYKLIAIGHERNPKYELYNLKSDKAEANDLSKTESEIFDRMKSEFIRWSASVDDSVKGKDYPAGRVLDNNPESHFWTGDKRYEPYFKEWSKRPEYKDRLKKHSKQQ